MQKTAQEYPRVASLVQHTGELQKKAPKTPHVARPSRDTGALQKTEHHQEKHETNHSSRRGVSRLTHKIIAVAILAQGEGSQTGIFEIQRATYLCNMYASTWMCGMKCTTPTSMPPVPMFELHFSVLSSTHAHLNYPSQKQWLPGMRGK